MAKKRDQQQRKRQVAKAQRGSERQQRSKPTPPQAPKVEPKAQMKDLWIAVGIVALIIGAFVAVYYFAVARPASAPPSTPPPAEATPDDEPRASAMSWAEPPEMAIDPAKHYEAILKTEKGDVRMELYAEQTPVTVNNFVFLARQGYYDGVTFHRVIPGFMAQTGDRGGTGSGSPGYAFQDEFDPALRHDAAGVVSMANPGTPDSNGSQFFITYAPEPHLDGLHTVFGRVVDGMDVVEALTPRNPAEDPGAPPGDRILSVEIVESD